MTFGKLLMHGEGLHTLLSKADSGDQRVANEAYTELLRIVKLLVSTGMGMRLRDHRDSGDVCQSIARSFVEDHRARLINFESEGELVAYLKTIVRSKLATLARADGAIKRGGNVSSVPLRESDSHADVAASADASSGLHARESLNLVQSQLSEDDQELARLKLAGLEWDQIGARLGMDPQSLRKRWSRLVARLADECAE